MTKRVGAPPSAPPLSDFELVVPDGLVLDPLTAAHLARLLAAASPDVEAVVARPVVVPAGSSARVVAERSLSGEEGKTAIEMADIASLRAAGVARPGGTVRVSADGHSIEGHGVWVDPKAGAVELVADRGPLVDADPTGRPTFTRRPLVVIAVGTGDTLEWASVMADHLIGHDTEVRLVLDGSLPPVAGGLTTACALTQQTIAALRPDVVVTLDDAVRQRVEQWCTERYTLVIEVEAELDDRVELVSWRHGQDRGRVRARIGPQVHAADLAALAARLCGGPPPALPGDIDARIDQPVGVAGLARPTVRRRAAGPIQSVALVGVPGGSLDARRWSGAVEQFALVGCAVEADPDPSQLDRFDLVLCGGAVADTLRASLKARRQRRAHTAVLIGHGDVIVAGDGTVSLTTAASALAQVTGRAMVPTVALQAVGPTVAAGPSKEGWHARYLPTALTGERIAALESAGASRHAGREPLLGWILDPAADPTPQLSMVQWWLRSHPAHSLTVATAGPLPGELDEHCGIRVVETLDPIDVAGWSAVAWSPAPSRAAGAGDVLDAVEFALVGVPILANDRDRATAGGIGELMAAPTSEVLALGPVNARHWGRRLHDRAAALHGSQAAAVQAHRILGWLLQDDTR